MICVREDHTGRGEAVNTLVERRPSGAERAAGPRLGKRFLFDAAAEPGGRPPGLAHLEPPQHALGLDRALGRRDPRRWRDQKCPPGRGRAGRVGRSAGMVARRRSLFRLRPRRGWWNLYRERDGAVEPMAPMDAEFGRPQWVFGMSTYAFESAERLICCFVKDGVWTLAQIDTRTKRFERDPDPNSPTFLNFAPVPETAVLFGGTPSQARRARRPRPERPGRLGSSAARPSCRTSVRAYISLPEPIAFPTDGGETAHAIFYPPFFPAFAAPAGEKAPVLVHEPRRADLVRLEHALARSPILDQSRHRRLDVNYRGSTGYGRAYRLKLERQWGVVGRRRLRSWREIPGRKPERRPESPHDRGRQRRRLYDALRASRARTKHLRRGREPLRRQRPRGAGARHAQIRVPLPRLAHRALSAGGAASTPSARRSTMPTGSRRRSSSSRAPTTRSFRPTRPSSWSPP